MSFLGEIGRRKVFRVAAVYAVVAWLIIQVVGEVSEPLNLPGWLDTTVIVLLAIGFPLVLILGWIFELTPAGVRRDEGEHERGSTPAAAPVFTYVVQGLVLVAVSFLLVDQFLLDDGSQPAASAVASEGEAGNVVRFRVPIADDAARFLGGEDDARFGWPASTSVALSNDGRLLVFSAWETDSEGQVSSRLYLRRLDREGAVAIAGSDGASAPFFAPDDANVGFFAGAALKRVSLANDRVETLVADAGLLGTAGVRGASWGPDGTIVYGGARGIYRVSANGGTPELLVDIGAAARLDLAQPLLLPGGRWLLFHAIADSYDPELAAIQVKDVVTGDERTLLTNAMNPVYLEATGHLLFMRVGALVAARFDADRAELVGEPVVVLEDVIQAVGMPNGGWDTGAAQLAVSRSGNIAYAGGGIYREAEGSSMLMRINLDGTVEPLLAGELNFNRVRVSPDGTRLAIEATRGRGFTLHVHDIARGVTQQLNSGSFRSARPVWSPDGSAIMFETFLEDGVGNLYLLSADGGTAPERLAPSPNQQNASSWSSTGAIAFLERNARGDRDIWVKPPDGAPEPFAASTEDETDAHFSPDGRWIAYASGRPLGRDDTQVYVRAYPGGGPAIQISGANGFCPAWSPDGRRLYFQTRIDDSRLDAMMVVDIESTEPFRASRARPLIDEWPARCNSPTRDYDVLPDGAFVAPVIDGDRVDLTNAERRLRQAVDEVHVVLNFAEELRRRAAN